MSNLFQNYCWTDPFKRAQTSLNKLEPLLKLFDYFNYYSTIPKLFGAKPSTVHYLFKKDPNEAFQMFITFPQLWK
jgi:hypothetical protein